LFDDFSGSSIDTGKWDVVETGGTISVADGELTCSAFASQSQKKFFIASKTSFGSGYIFEVREKHITTGNLNHVYPTFGFNNYVTLDWVVWIDTASSNTYWYYYIMDNGSPVIYDTTDALSTSYKKYQIERYGTTNVKWYIDSVEKQSSNLGLTDSLPITIGMHTNIDGDNLAASIKVDWVFVRKYTATKPSISFWGEEETI
jgi:hypothetical protein